MQSVVAFVTDRNQIVIVKRQLWIVLQMVDVVDDSSPVYPAVLHRQDLARLISFADALPADLTFIVITL